MQYLRSLVVALMVAVSACACAHPLDETSPELARALLASVVKVEIERGQDSASGSGVVVDVHNGETLIVTAAHVCMTEATFKIVSFYIKEHPQATVLLRDEANDVCVLRAPGFVGIAAELASEEPPIAAKVVGVSAPRGLYGLGLGSVQDWRYAGTFGLTDHGPEAAAYAGHGTSGSSGGGVFYHGKLVGLINGLLASGPVGGPVIGATLEALTVDVQAAKGLTRK